MIRKLAVRAGAGNRPAEEDRPKNRAFLFFFFTLGAGALAAIIALVGPGLVTDAGAVVTNVIITNSSSSPIKAQTLFPAVPAVHKVVDVYDPPPARKAQPAPAPAPPAAAHTTQPNPSPSPRPTPSHSPRPTPSGSPPPDN